MTTYLQRYIFGCIMLFAFSSCYYYKATTLSGNDNRIKIATLDSLQSANRYLILRNGNDDYYHIQKLQRSDDGKSLMLSLDSVSEVHRYLLNRRALPNKRYRKSKSLQNQVVTEVHVYTAYRQDIKTGEVTLPLESIEKIDVLKHDAKRTVNSHVLSGLGIAAAGAGITILIIFLSIPFD